MTANPARCRSTEAGVPVRDEGQRLPVAARRARVAVSAIFFVHGAVFASWAARVPAVQSELRLSAGLLGLVLAGPGLGALVGSQAGGLLVRRLGSRAVSAMAPVLLSVPLGLIPTAHSARSLMILLVLLGAVDGCTSVAMNTQAVAVQRRYGRAVLNSMHAVRSIGAVAGGLAAVATTALGLPLALQFVAMAAVLAIMSTVAACGLGPDGEPDRHAPQTDRTTQPRQTPAAQMGSDAGPTPARKSRTGAPRAPDSGRRDKAAHGRNGRNGRITVLLLALMTFLAALVEDAPASWSGVYLRHVGAHTATAAAGYAAFSAGSVITRLINDWLVDRIGWTRLIRAGTLCCAAALSAALLLGRPGTTLAALVVAGAGISAVFPGAFSAAGRLPDPALAMGQVGFAGNLGWLLVSPVIGGLATLTGLPAALSLLAAAAVTIAGLAPITRPTAPAPPKSERTLPHLRGRRGSRPVRVGNGAWSQQQIDVYGELLDAAYRLADQLERIDDDARRFLIACADTAAERWTEKDQGILGGARGAPPLPVLEGDVLDGAGPRHPPGRPRRRVRGPGREVTADPRRDP